MLKSVQRIFDYFQIAIAETLAKRAVSLAALESQRRDLNPRPLDYESSALPLSHVGMLDASIAVEAIEMGHSLKR